MAKVIVTPTAKTQATNPKGNVPSAKGCIEAVGPGSVDVGNGRTKTVFRSMDEMIAWKEYCKAEEAGPFGCTTDATLDYRNPCCSHSMDPKYAD